MHGRQSSFVCRTLRTSSPCRTTATATANKPLTLNPNKWEIPQASSSASATSAQKDSGPSRWAHPTALNVTQAEPSTTPTYKPNVSKWAPRSPPSSKAPETPIASILDNLASSASFSRIPRSSGSRKWGEPATGEYKQASKAPSGRSPTDSQLRRGSRLDRDEAPHLSKESERATAPQSPARSRPASERSSSIGRGPERKRERTAAAGYAESLNAEQADMIEDATVDFDDVEEEHTSRRSYRNKFKARGSLVERLMKGDGIEIPSHARTHDERVEVRKRIKKRIRKIKPVNLDVFIPSIISVGNLARLLNVRLEVLQRCMRRNDMESQSSFDHVLSADDASLLALEFDRNPIVDDEAAFDIYASPPHPNYTSLPLRPPVVTIMGHVDHGKTTLLDNLRSASVAKGEAGGITQHIGAFSVPVPSITDSPDIPNTITFLDTPGHAAFSAMRARGSRVTDIIVLVVAADDGVMPQTREVIDLIKKEKDKVGVVVAINKVDKPEADIANVQSELWAEGIELESMGGDIPSVEVSGITGQGLDQLVETISALAELQDIRAEIDGPAHGYILESKVQKGLGNTATVLLLRGKLTPSSYIISGTTFAKVRQLTNVSGETVKAALPGSAVTVSGWKELPQAGEEVLQGKEDDVKKAVDNRIRKASLESTLHDAEAINTARQQEREDRDRKASEPADAGIEQRSTPPTDIGPKELRLIIKGDVSGSVEALSAAAESIGNKHAITKVISTGVGEVTESDVALAKAADAIIVAFSVNVSRMANQAATQNEVSIFSSNIIYRVLDEVKASIIKLLPTITESRVTGEANVLQLFDIQGRGRTIIKVAGCRVANGIVEKTKRAKVIRSGMIVHDGTLQTLRIGKRDVVDVKKGLECGMSLADFQDLREGDLIQFYDVIEKPGQL